MNPRSRDAPRATRAPVLERDLQRTIVELAKLTGWLVHHTRPAMNRRGRWETPIQGDTGFPDLVLVKHGRLVFMEIKSEKGKFTPEQRAWLWTLGSLSTLYGDIDATLDLLGFQRHIKQRVYPSAQPIRVLAVKPCDWPLVEATLKGSA